MKILKREDKTRIESSHSKRKAKLLEGLKCHKCGKPFRKVVESGFHSEYEPDCDCYGEKKFRVSLG